MTGLLSPEVLGIELHQSLGSVSAAMAATTLGLGFISHYNEVGLNYGFSSNNLHALLEITGGTMMLIAPFSAPNDAHQALRMGGTFTIGFSLLMKVIF